MSYIEVTIMNYIQ